MNNMIELQNLLGANELYKWLASTIVFSILYSAINISAFKTLLNIEFKPKTVVFLLVIDSFFKAICSIFIISPYYRLVNMVISIVLLKLFSRTKYRKMHYK